MSAKHIACFFLVSSTILLGGVTLRAAPGASQPRGLKKALQDFHDFYSKGLAETGIVGSSIVLIHDNRLIDTLNYGLADKEKAIRANDHTIYHWASITKTMTGIAIMQLRDRGLLRLEDPVTKYVPELREVHNPFGDMDEITIKQLMTHSAGFRSATWPWKDKPWQPFEPLHWQQLAAMFPYTEIEFKPGSQWSYSNLGIVFLGRIIELLTADDYEVYIDKNILKPLEMYESYFDSTPYHLLRNRAQSYFLKGSDLTPAPFDANTGITVSNGGLNAPISDFAKYLNFLMGDPKKQDIYDIILKRISLEEMFQPVLPTAPESQPAPVEEVGTEYQGLIFFIEQHFGMRFIAHSGNQNAFISSFYYQQDSRTSYAVAYNTLATPKDSENSDSKGSTGTLDREIRSYLFKRIFPLFAPKNK
jgi:CubicO group peptidase (beta-lactamase class C family)